MGGFGSIQSMVSSIQQNRKYINRMYGFRLYKPKLRFDQRKKLVLERQKKFAKQNAVLRAELKIEREDRKRKKIILYSSILLVAFLIALGSNYWLSAFLNATVKSVELNRPNSQPSYNRRMKLASFSYHSGKLDDALLHYGHAIELRPKSMPAHLGFTLTLNCRCITENISCDIAEYQWNHFTQLILEDKANELNDSQFLILGALANNSSAHRIRKIIQSFVEADDKTRATLYAKHPDFKWSFDRIKRIEKEEIDSL